MFIGKGGEGGGIGRMRLPSEHVSPSMWNKAVSTPLEGPTIVDPMAMEPPTSLLGRLGVPNIPKSFLTWRVVGEA